MHASSFDRTRRSAPVVLALCSGAAALVYELAWARWLTLTLGATSRGLAVSTASMMLGFAVGGGVLGGVGDRAPRPLRLYGLLEACVGLSALGVSALLRAATTASWAASVPLPVLVLGALLAVGIPTALMGATMPALGAYYARYEPDRLRPALVTVYAANTAGAVLGTLATGFLLVEAMGWWASVSLGVLANLAIGLAALALDRRLDPPAIPVAEPPRHAPDSMEDDVITRAALAAAAVSGFAAMAHEVLSFRLLVYGLLATTHALALALAVFLAGLAGGAVLVRVYLRRRDVSLGLLGASLLGGGALALATGALLTRSAVLFEALRGTDLSWGRRILAESVTALLALLPATLVMGATFPAAAALLARTKDAGARIGRAVLVNTLAGVAGSLGAAFVLAPALGVRRALVAVAVVQLAAGAWLLPRRRALAGVAVALTAAAGLAWARAPELGAAPGERTPTPQHIVGREREFRLRCYREGPTAITEVVEHLPTGRRDVLIDGFVAAGTSPTANYMDLMGRLPMVLHPNPTTALVICFGTGTTARAVASFPRAAVDLVDLNPDVFACAPAFGPENPRLFRRARVHVEDGRAFLRRPSTARYSVITQEPMPPHFAGVSALYSVEYYRLARARLASDGVLVQWLPMHLTAPEDTRQIAAAALAVFPETWLALAPGDLTGLLVCSQRPLDPGRRELAARRLGVQWALDPAGVGRLTRGADPVTDDLPALEYNGIDRVFGEFRSAQRLLRYNLSRVAAAQRADGRD